ncbi:MAG: DUF4157 domain-containing protein [Chloroflexi bacterium]|nr:DUF4157 domain-containing protein [Chloroflexota bacterium]
MQRTLESGLHADLSNVRVHSDGEADELSRAVDAEAFTSGSDIFFRRGTLNPRTPRGLHVLAHEAVHTIQQARGPVGGYEVPGGVSISRPGDPLEREAEGMAARITAGIDGVTRQTGSAALWVPPGTRGRSAGSRPVQRIVTPAAAARHVPHRTLLPIQRLPPNVVPAQSAYAAVASGSFPEDHPKYGRMNIARAGTVVATIIPGRADPANHLHDGVPTVHILGWDWVSQVRISDHEWVRFHILNHNIGGPGDEETNLIPTRQSDNKSGAWSAFQGVAINLCARRVPVHFEATIAYYAQHVGQVPQNQPGLAEVHKFPQQIQAWLYAWDNPTGQWVLYNTALNPVAVPLAPPPTFTWNFARPPLDPNNVEHILVDSTEGGLLRLHVAPWLAKRIIENQDIIYNQFSNQPGKTVQDLYDLLREFTRIRPGDAQNPEAQLNHDWASLETKLNATAGHALRIVEGWQPNGSSAVLSHAISIGPRTDLATVAHNLGVDYVFVKAYADYASEPFAAPRVTGFYSYLVRTWGTQNMIQKVDPLWPGIVDRMFIPRGWYIERVHLDQNMVMTETQRIRIIEDGAKELRRLMGEGLQGLADLTKSYYEGKIGPLSETLEGERRRGSLSRDFFEAYKKRIVDYRGATEEIGKLAAMVKEKVESYKRQNVTEKTWTLFVGEVDRTIIPQIMALEPGGWFFALNLWDRVGGDRGLKKIWDGLAKKELVHRCEAYAAGLGKNLTRNQSWYQTKIVDYLASTERHTSVSSMDDVARSFEGRKSQIQEYFNRAQG